MFRMMAGSDFRGCPKFGEGGQNFEEHFADRVRRIVDRCAEGELDAFPHVGQCLVETRAGAVGTRQPVVGIDAVDVSSSARMLPGGSATMPSANARK